VILAAFSAATYLNARRSFHHLVDERPDSALAVLAAAEVHPGDVEWEPQECVLPIGQDGGADRLRWMVFDDEGRRVDQSRNLTDSEPTPVWAPRPGSARLPDRLTDRAGRTWRVAQRRVVPSAPPPSGSRSASDRGASSAVGVEPPTPASSLHRALVLTACAPLGPTESALATLGWSLGLGAVGFWLVAALLCRGISRRALTPLTRLAESARGPDAAEPGWSLELAGTGDELDELGRAFNDLLARLHLAFVRQRRYSGDASHQLRTPLTILIGQIGVALRQDRTAEEYRRVLKSALARAMHLGQIVEALLFLSRAEGEAQLPGLEAVDLNRWVASHLASRPEVERPAGVVHREAGGPAPWVRVHPALLDQLLSNLLDNAAKYGPPGGPVVVETGRDGPDAVLAVEDAGLGVAPEDVPRLFEPFSRSPRVRRRGTPGVGLGLAVVQRIAATFGGRVGVRGEPGRGCRFEVRLPAVATADQPARVGADAAG
jgi:signal transduction histidine kinase